MKVSIVLLLFCCLINPICAQDSIILNYKNAINIALEKNVNIKQQENNVLLSRVTQQQGIASFLPSLNIANYATNTKSGYIDKTTGELVKTNINTLSYSINASYTLFNGFYRLNNLLQTTYQYKAQISSLEQVKQNTIYNTTIQYLQILLDEELIKITSEYLNVQRVVYEQIKGYVDVNIKSISEQYTQEAQVNLTIVQLMTLKNQLFSDKALLSSLLMLNEGTQIKLIVPDWGIESTLLKNLNPDSLQEIAKINRPDLKQLNQLIMASKYGVRVARASVYPNLQANYSYGSGYDESNTFKNRTIAFKDQFYTNNLKQIIGLTLNIPIFNQFQYRTNITSAKITYRNNELNLEMQKFNVYAQVQTAYNNFLTYKEKYNASLAGYIASKLAFEKQLERFKLGIGNIVEFSLASQNFLQAQSVKVQSEYALLFQKIIMDYYTGTLNNIAISY